MPTSTFVTKRPHKKSRRGCRTCKAKKVKCDEAQPVCGYCELRNLECEYVTSSTRSRPLYDLDSSLAPSQIELYSPKRGAPTPSRFSLLPGCGDLKTLELYMMHHYSTYATKNLACGDGPTEVLQCVLPVMALESSSMMAALFGVAARHHQILAPSDTRFHQQFLNYRNEALTGFRKELVALQKTSDLMPLEQYERLIVLSLMMVLLFSTDSSTTENLVTVRILNLYRGLHMLLAAQPENAFLVIKGPRVGPLFQRDPNEIHIPFALPMTLLSMLATINPDDPDAANLEALCSALDDLGMLYACLRQEGRSANLGQRIQSWLSRPQDPFVTMAMRKNPRALIILAHSLCFIKLFSLWWLDGLPNQDIMLIKEIVGPEWESYLDVPCMIVKLQDADEIAVQLLAE